MRIEPSYANCRLCGDFFKNGQKIWVYNFKYFCTEYCVTNYLHKYEVGQCEAELDEE